MANPYILYTDLSNYTFSSSLASNTTYPTTNLNNYMVNSYWKSASDDPSMLYITFPWSVSFSHVVIDGHNFHTMGADEIMLQKANDAAFTSGVTNVIEFGEWLSDNTTAVIPMTGLTYSGRYFRIVFETESTLADYPTLANIFFGSPVYFNTPYVGGFKIKNNEYKTNEVTTIAGTTRATQQYKGRTVYDLKFTLQNDTLRTAFQAFVSAVRGKLYPFYFIDTDTVVYYMNLDSDYVPVTAMNATGYYNIDSLVMKTNRAIY